MIRLLIKGDRQAVAEALYKRDIAILEDIIERKDALFKGQLECLVKVHDCFLGKVLTWFNESPIVAPFPPGTLLYFAETELAELI
jgi:hypothetical protein